MAKIKRIFPGATNGLINWMEENFHDIDGYVVTFNLKDGDTMTVYDAYSPVQALGLVEVGKQEIHNAIYEDEFIQKEY
ncbi:hypothetical protein [Peribacillus loiseleuriae]|uniref:hypothetical protein n=1 Tax=Peribacillus loiseleuriae TaxID=1679170 RepID=UPI003D04F677